MKYRRGHTTVVVSFEDAEPLTGRASFSDTKREIIPRMAEISYSAATPGHIDAILRGRPLKKDGTPASAEIAVSIVIEGKDSSGKPRAPKWLREIAKEFGP